MEPKLVFLTILSSLLPGECEEWPDDFVSAGRNAAQSGKSGAPGQVQYDRFNVVVQGVGGSDEVAAGRASGRLKKPISRVSPGFF